jgi:hypothetical protein
MHLPTLRSRTNYQFARLETDLGNTGFWEGHEFRLSYELDITDTFVFKFTSAVDFIIQSQVLDVDQDGIKLSVYRASQGVDNGGFTTPVDFYANNAMSDTPSYSSNASLNTGGIFTVNGGELPVEVLRVRSASASAQKTTVEATAGDERGLPAGSYYLQFSVLSGNNPLGVYALKWEERPVVS